MNKDKILEWLSVYGWAFLVVFAAVGALAYLGILNPNNWVSEGLNETINDTPVIDEYSDYWYHKGLVIGCDLGCIDADLRANGYDWDTPESEYDILASESYQACSNYCLTILGGEE